MSASIRSQFLLNPTVVFLNHGSFGACPIPVFETYQNWQRRLERQPVLFLGREYSALEREAAAALAAFLHTQPGNLVFIPNATFGVNAVARSLNLQPGDEILTSDHEYGACDNAWNFLCLKTGAKVVRMHIPMPEDGDEDGMVEQLWKGVSGRTRVVYLSHITSPTALTFPVEKICRKAREAGILSAIDGAHAPGQIPLDLEAVGADFYFGNLHKWLMSPKGAAFLYVRSELRDQVEPFVVSWGYSATPETSLGSKLLDGYQWTGTMDPSAYLTVPSAIWFQRENHWDQVQQSCHELLRPAIARICEMVGMAPPYPLDSAFYHQMAVAPLPAGTDLISLKARLYDEFRVEVPLTEWSGRKFVRVSVQGYNTPEDLERLFEGLQALLTIRLSPV